MSVEIGICCTLFCNAQLSKHCHQVARDGWRDSLGRAVRLYRPHCGLTLGNSTNVLGNLTYESKPSSTEIQIP